MSINIQTSAGLIPLSAKVTKSQVITALGYAPTSETIFNTHKQDTTIHVTVADRERWDNPLTDDSNHLSIVDSNGNIIALIDDTGVHSVDFHIGADSVKSQLNQLAQDIQAIPDQLPFQSDGNDTYLSVEDSAGNKILHIDGTGMYVPSIYAKEIDVISARFDELFVGGAPLADIITKLAQGISDIVAGRLDGHIGDITHLTQEQRDKLDTITNNEGNHFTLQDENGNVAFQVDDEGAKARDFQYIDIVTNGDKTKEEVRSLREVIAGINQTTTGLANADVAMDLRVDLLEQQIGGVSGAMHFKGVEDEVPTNTAEYLAGDVVIVGNKEWVFNGREFVEFGDIDAISGRVTNLEKTINHETTGLDTKASFSYVDAAITRLGESIVSKSDEWIIADESGNIAARVSEDGLEITSVTAKSIFINGTDVKTTLDNKVDVSVLSKYYTKNETKEYTDNVVAQKSQVQIITWEEND